MDARTEQTLFDLPVSPDQISILLPPAKLRRINFSALDFTTARDATFEYIRTYYPDDFNDFVASNGIIMLSEVQASNVSKIALRGDLLSNEGFLPTCTTELAATQHLALINQKFRTQTPAVVDIEVTVQSPLTTNLEISPGMRFTVKGPDNKPVYYEIYRAPGDFTSNIVVPASKRGVIAFGLEGRSIGPVRATSTGGINQTITISNSSILEQPVTVQVCTGPDCEYWTVVTEPLERYGPNDKVVNAQFYSDYMTLTFGDDVNGKAPLAGQEIQINYRIGGGSRGRIGSYAIDETRPVSPLPPADAPIQVLFRNTTPSSGGTDRETLEQVKKRAPRDFAVRAFATTRPASIVTDADYVEVAGTFAHPVYGAVAKAIATIRTGLNANLVELYILAQGANGLVTPSLGLKLALQTYIDEFNVLTDTLSVLDGAVKPIEVDMTVVVNRNADASFVRTQVNEALNTFFATTNREMGQALYITDIIEIITAIDGVLYVDLFQPANNILPTGLLGGANPTDATGVGVNEIIVEAQRNIRIYYEKGRT